MILYVDETENEEYFIVTGLLVNSEKEINDAYYSFKKHVNLLKIPKRYKSKLFVEFKSNLLDYRFQKVKKVMLESLNLIPNSIIYASYVKKDKHLKQSLKDKRYIQLVNSIIESIELNTKIDVIFDSLPNKNSINCVIDNLARLKNIASIKPADSQLTPGLQYVDNLCSVIRLHISQYDKNDFYELIKNNTRKVTIKKFIIYY